MLPRLDEMTREIQIVLKEIRRVMQEGYRFTDRSNDSSRNLAPLSTPEMPHALPIRTIAPAAT